MAKKTSESISFRLAPEFAKALAEEAGKRNESPGECARRLLIASLNGDAQAEVLQKLAQSRNEILKLREDVATSALVVLVRVGNEDPEKAREWVMRNLGR